MRLGQFRNETSGQQAATGELFPSDALDDLADGRHNGAENLKGVVDGLSDGAWTALKLLFFLAPEPISQYDVNEELPRFFSGKRALAAALEELNENGLLFALKSEKFTYYRTAVLVALPDEARMAAAYRLVDEVSAKGIVRPFPEPPGDESLDRVDDDMYDLTTLLAEVTRRPRRVTQERTLYKREQKKLQERFRHPEEVPKGDGAAYPLGLGLMMEYASYDALVAMRDDGASLHLTAGPYADRWASRPLAWRKARFQAYWWQSGIAEDGLRPVLELLLALPDGKGLLVESLLQWVERMMGENGPTAHVRWNFGRFRHVGERAGLLRVADASNIPQLGLRPRKHAARYLVAANVPPALGESATFPERDDETFVVQPNFEVMISQEAPAERVWRLYQCCDLVQSDRMMRFSVTRESLLEATELGFTGPDIIRFLEEESRFPIPENVRYSVEEWVGRAGLSRLVEAILLRCDTEELAGELAGNPDVAPLLLERVGPTHFLVSDSRVRPLVAALERAGRPPARRLHVATPDGLVPTERIEDEFEGGAGRPGVTDRSLSELRELLMDELMSDEPWEDPVFGEVDWEDHIGGRPELPLDFDGAGSLRPVPVAHSPRDLLGSYKVVPVKALRWGT